jgi:hypothetical protein
MVKCVTKEGCDDSDQRIHQYGYLPKFSVYDSNPSRQGIQESYGEHTQEGDHGFC